MRTRTGKYPGAIDRLLRRFAAARSGATAIEFALLGPIFFALIGATMETAVVYFAGQALDSAIQESSRLVRTGEAQSLDGESFRTEVCDHLYGIFACDDIHLTVTPITDFADYTDENPMDPESGEMTGAEVYDTGEGASVMKVEAYYKWPTVLNIPGLMVGLTPDGKRLLSATRVFRNEPF